MTDSNLDYWLGRCYEHYVIRGSADSTVMDLFKGRLAASQQMMGDAKARLSGYHDDVLKRDFISRKNKEFLTTALGV